MACRTTSRRATRPSTEFRMIPQSSFMVLAPIEPRREAALRELLASMNDAPGRANANNAVIPFARFGALHVARLVIIDDKTVEDVRLYGLSPEKYPLYLALLGDIDGNADAFLGTLAGQAASGLRAIFSCCAGFSSDTDLLRWMKQHSVKPAANYVNWHGRTVQRAREEAALFDALQSYIDSDPSVCGLP